MSDYERCAECDGAIEPDDHKATEPNDDGDVYHADCAPAPIARPSTFCQRCGDSVHQVDELRAWRHDAGPAQDADHDVIVTTMEAPGVLVPGWAWRDLTSQREYGDLPYRIDPADVIHVDRDAIALDLHALNELAALFSLPEWKVDGSAASFIEAAAEIVGRVRTIT